MTEGSPRTRGQTGSHAKAPDAPAAAEASARGWKSPLVFLQGGVLALGGWIVFPSPWWIATAAVLVVPALLLSRMGRRETIWAGVFLAAAVASAFVAEQRLSALADGWSERADIWEAETQDRLAAELDALLEAKEASVAALGGVWARTGTPEGNRIPDAFLQPGVDALALFGPGGRLLAWTGMHQGPIPEAARMGESRYLYREGALFGYLYVTEPLTNGGGTAVSISLLRADLPVALESRPISFTQRFEVATGAQIRISRSDRVAGESVWDLRWEDEALFSVAIAPPSEADARRLALTSWSRWLLFLMGVAWLLAMLGARRHPLAPGVGTGVLFVLLLTLPIGRILGFGFFSSPAGFLLPGPIPLTLGQLLVAGGVGALGAGLLSPKRIPLVPLPVAAALGVGGAVALLELLSQGSTPGFVSGLEGGWVALQAGAAGLVVLPLWMALLMSRRPVSREEGQPIVLGMSLVLALALSLGYAYAAGRGPGAPLWLGALWVLPFALLLLAVPSATGWRDGAIRWGSVAVLAASLSLPWGWGERIEARITMAEERIERLGTRPDSFMEFLLLRGGEEAQRLAREGFDPVEVLYGAWTESGLAREGVPLWITLWGPDWEPQEELRIGLTDPRPVVPPTFLQEARREGVGVLRRLDLGDTHYMAAVPLERDEVLTIVVPPRRRLAGESPLGPLFGPARGEPDPLVLVPLVPGEIPGVSEGVAWVRAGDLWQGEVYLVYPDELYHAHYVLELPGTLLLLARGTLLLFLDLTVLGLLWGLGRWVGSGVPGTGGRVWGVITSFRGRVTLTLFAFFLIPSILFGTLAYRTLAGASVRTAEALAQRAIEDAASWYPEVEGAMDLLARRVGSDLLLFENGELVAASTSELLGLGLYEGWLPPEVHADMARGEEVMTTTIAALGGWEYVMAYRRVSGERVLATPAPLQAGATALRQRDVADLLGFSVVLGGLLSILLSLLVGRALTRPIQTLQVASERVGAGNMGVQLPEDRRDEFGAVFAAFNRMVARLARTRRALLRSSRRTRAIVEEVATGVVAFDPQGRVTLANPRAEELLGAAIRPGRPLSESAPSSPVGASVVEWVEGYFRDAVREAGSEFASADRRIRVRARRISARGPMGGAVLTLEDVTDELRSERILAWGEMAQQVAHEVKNPLTPIRLGVQHVRRAWEDRRPDFDDILRRNVDAILKEIDRLAAIAASFSRYAAPTPVGPAPLEPVDLQALVADVLDLYQAGEGPVAFSASIDAGLPRLATREGELKEVLINLLENARNAQAGGGRVEIHGERAGPGGAVELRVRDEGPGIPADLLTRIFEPHFSTRSGGTGLGLAIVRRLVESWGGKVWAESQTGFGTTVVVRIPGWSSGEREGGAEKVD